MKFAQLTIGDLLFWRATRSARLQCQNFNAEEDREFSDAVSAAGGDPSAPFHVSLIKSVDTKNQSITDIIHATDRGVVRDKFQDYSSRLLELYPKIEIIHCAIHTDSNNDALKEKAVAFAASKIGREYNDIFSEDCRNSNSQEAYYCCQLVRKSYEHALGRPLFELQPLNFRDANGSLIEYWYQYFNIRGLAVPENQQGSHPAGLMKCDFVRVIDRVVLTRAAATV